MDYFSLIHGLVAVSFLLLPGWLIFQTTFSFFPMLAEFHLDFRQFFAVYKGSFVVCLLSAKNYMQYSSVTSVVQLWMKAKAHVKCHLNLVANYMTQLCQQRCRPFLVVSSRSKLLKMSMCIASFMLPKTMWCFEVCVYMQEAGAKVS